MHSELLEQGVSLLIYGMGTVFVFLIMLVFATKAMSALVRTATRDSAHAAATTEDRGLVNTDSDINDDIKTAIQQAIRLYRQHH